MTPKAMSRLRDQGTLSPLLRAALDSDLDEPTSGELERLGIGLGVGLGLPPSHPPYSPPVGSGLAAIVKSKIVSTIIIPALVGGAAATAAVKATGTTFFPTPATSAKPASPPPLPEPVQGAQSPGRGAKEKPPTLPATTADRLPSANAKDRATVDALPMQPLPAAPTNFEPSPATRETEVGLLERAKALTERDPAAALILTSEHAARFPNGMLGQEAQVITIEALVSAGRMSDAADRLLRFRGRFPGSAYLPHLEALVRRSK